MEHNLASAELFRRKITSTTVKAILEKIIGIIPRVGAWRAAFLKHSTPGHFYSPVPDVEEVKLREAEIFQTTRPLLGIDFNDQTQLDLLEKLKPFLPEAPWAEQPQSGLLFHYDNIYYTWSDALSLYGLMRVLKPQRIIEVGSGWSSALMLDTNRLFFEDKITLTFIEPFPDRLNALAAEAASTRLIQSMVQHVPIETFEQLKAGDFLFIDTSHVSKVGSDVNHLLFEVLPRLNGGVYLHFHDIFYPFEYPKEWIYKGYAWNENYILRAYLMDNPHFEIVFMNTYLEHKYPNRLPEQMFTRFKGSITGGIWLRKR